MFVLWDDSARAEEEFGFVKKQAGWKNHPVGLFDHVTELPLQEWNVFFGGLARTTFKASKLFPFVPQPGVHCCKDAVGLAACKEMAGLV